MKKELKCGICYKEIDTKKEYSELRHYKKLNSLLKSGYYHINCFRDRLHGGEAYRNLSAKANWILDKVAQKV